MDKKEELKIKLLLKSRNKKNDYQYKKVERSVLADGIKKTQSIGEFRERKHINSRL
jgi:hypothetical protein